MWPQACRGWTAASWPSARARSAASRAGLRTSATIARCGSCGLLAIQFGPREGMAQHHDQQRGEGETADQGAEANVDREERPDGIEQGEADEAGAKAGGCELSAPSVHGIHAQQSER